MTGKIESAARLVSREQPSSVVTGRRQPLRAALLGSVILEARQCALGGSGIGLTIAQSLVQAMQGDIHVESAGLGQGSSFTLTLPQAHA